MEIQPDFDASEVARTVALAVSNLHNRTASSDSGNDESPLMKSRSSDMNINADLASEDTKKILPSTSKRCCPGISARHVLVLLGFLGFCNVYALRVNLSVALVAMVNGTAVYQNKSETNECELRSNSTSDDIKDGEFIWSTNTQGTIMGAFFYGYLITQIPGGRMAELVGGKWLFGIGVACTSILTLLTPVAARWGASALVVLRILEGLGEGVTFPAMHAMLGRWTPKLERSMLTTITYSGAQIGTVIAMPISGMLCDSDFLGGWPSVFYVFGIVGCVWFMFWVALVYETPDEHPRITKAELLLIQCGRDEESKGPKDIPWKAIWTSVPVWTLMITHFGQNWGFYTFLTELPTYLSTILHFKLNGTGFLAGLPYLLYAVVSWTVSYFADLARRKHSFDISTIRKVCNSIGFFGPALCLVGVILAGCNHLWSVVFLTLAMGFNGFTYSGYMVTHVDMSPEFAGTLMGMTNAFATITGFLAPAVVGVLTNHNQTLFQWRIVFYIAIAVYIITGILFIVCGSAKPQKFGAVQSEFLNKVRSVDRDSDVDEKQE